MPRIELSEKTFKKKLDRINDKYRAKERMLEDKAQKAVENNELERIKEIRKIQKKFTWKR